MGTKTGVVFCFEPALIEKGTVVKYNNKKETLYEKKVILVKWFEASEVGENTNKFIVVFEDGTIYVFFRDTKSPAAGEQKIV